MQKKLKDIAEIKFCILEKGCDDKYLLTPANLLDDNQISLIEKDQKFKKDSNVILKRGDIIVKRINPSYINYIDREYQDVYVGNNLIIVRAITVEPKYLAAVLNSNIKKYSRINSIGAVIPSIGRKEVEEIEIEVCNKKKQKLIGEYWIKSIEKRNLEKQKVELEKKKIILIINKIFSKDGGSKND